MVSLLLFAIPLFFADEEIPSTGLTSANQSAGTFSITGATHPSSANRCPSPSPHPTPTPPSNSPTCLSPL